MYNILLYKSCYKSFSNWSCFNLAAVHFGLGSAWTNFYLGIKLSKLGSATSKILSHNLSQRLISENHNDLCDRTLFEALTNMFTRWLQVPRPDLWRWPKKWSRLGWTLQEWTSLTAHTKWVKGDKFQRRESNRSYLRQNSCCSFTDEVISTVQPAKELALRKSVCCLQVIQRKYILCSWEEQPGWHFSCGLVTVCNVICELAVDPSEPSLCRSLIFGWSVADLKPTTLLPLKVTTLFTVTWVGAHN